jgi:hypothetical protein
MKWKALGAAVAAVLLSTLAFGQAAAQYLDIEVVQVKPEKRADFDAITKKMVAANRQNKGDNWLAIETVYGEGNRVTFISTRNSYAETEAASDVFYSALQKAYGKAGVDKMFQEFSQCVTSTHSELRRRRWDLSSNPPADPAAEAKLIGDARWLRTVTVHVKPGQADALEGELKEMKAAREKTSPPVTTLVSQSVAGQDGTLYYVTTLENSMAGFDSIPPTQKVLGEEGYAKFIKVSAEAVQRADTAINRFLPDLSNPPEQVVAVAPDYWNPKPMVAAKAKPKNGEMMNAAEKGKADDKNK